MKSIDGTNWVNDAVANPNQAVSIMQKYSGLNVSDAQSIFQHFFVSSYQAAMWLLVASSLMALLVIFFGMRKN